MKRLILGLVLIGGMAACNEAGTPTSPSTSKQSLTAQASGESGGKAKVMTTSTWDHVHCGPPITIHRTSGPNPNSNACGLFTTPHPGISTVSGGGTGKQVCSLNATIAVLDSIWLTDGAAVCP